MVGSLVIVGAASAVAILMALLVTALAARRAGRISVIDTTWGAAFALVGLVSAATADWLGAGDPWRTWLVALLVVVWGLRLSWHLYRRNAGTDEDPRYAEMLERRRCGVVVARVFGAQGLVLWVVSLPVQLAAVGEVPSGWLPVLVLGAACWSVGVGFESVGDAQLAAYRSISHESGTVMSTGLWRYTRHPNYFGDACVWWGLWLAGIAQPWWLWLVIALSPALMTYLLVFASGARLLERSMMQRPGYPEYAARTSMFLPLPPRRSAGGATRGPVG